MAVPASRRSPGRANQSTGAGPPIRDPELSTVSAPADRRDCRSQPLGDARGIVPAGMRSPTSSPVEQLGRPQPEQVSHDGVSFDLLRLEVDLPRHRIG